MKTRKRHNYTKYNLKACTTLDVEHFHATSQVKCTTLSMLQYCIRLGVFKESLERITDWNVYYFTQRQSWYLKLVGTVKFAEIPSISQFPERQMSDEDKNSLCNLQTSTCGLLGRELVGNKQQWHQQEQFLNIVTEDYHNQESKCYLFQQKQANGRGYRKNISWKEI